MIKALNVNELQNTNGGITYAEAMVTIGTIGVTAGVAALGGPLVGGIAGVAFHAWADTSPCN